jgi:hypothetical protein
MCPRPFWARVFVPKLGVVQLCVVSVKNDGTAVCTQQALNKCCLVETDVEKLSTWCCPPPCLKSFSY